MRDPVTREYFGPYRLVRPLDQSAVADRWMALHVRSQTSHVVHRFLSCRDRAERRRFLDAFETLSGLRHPHLLRIEQFSFGSAGRPWGVTPYPGNQDGLVTLDRLVDLKGGRLGEHEGARAITQILQGAAYAHERGVVHGPLETHEVLIDRHGSLLVEHYGLGRLIQANAGPHDEAIREEVASIAGLGYALLTGMVPDEPMIQASRANRRLDRAWDGWFARALDAGTGFGTAQSALEALPGQSTDAGTPGPVQVVLRKLRRPVDVG